jgi:hypothetical protein
MIEYPKIKLFNLRDLDNGIINKIFANLSDWSDLSNYEYILDIIKDSKLLMNTNFAQLPSINTNILNISIVKNKRFDVVKDQKKNLECNIYYNKYRIKKLFEKYHKIIYQKKTLIEPHQYTIETLNQILLRTITNNTDYTNIDEIERNQQILIEFGANITYINGFMTYTDGTILNNLTSIVIPKIITHIGDNTFRAINITNKIIIPDSVIFIGDHAFQNINMTDELIIPESVIYIGDYAFNNNRLNKVTIPESVIYIGTYAFVFNDLRKVIIPKRFKKQIKDIFGTYAAKKIKFNYTTINLHKSLKDYIKDIFN